MIICPVLCVFRVYQFVRKHKERFGFFFSQDRTVPSTHGQTGVGYLVKERAFDDVM